MEIIPQLDSPSVSSFLNKYYVYFVDISLEHRDILDMSERKQNLNMIQKEFEQEFRCVNCNSMCPHSHAFGRLECNYHPGELVELKHTGSNAPIHNQYGKSYDVRVNSLMSNYVVRKWSCCGQIENDHVANTYHPYFHGNRMDDPDDYYASGEGCGKRRKYSFIIHKKLPGCKKCDHLATPYKKDETPIYEEVPADMLNYAIFPFPKNVLPMKVGKNEFGLIDKSLTVFPVKRFEI